MHRRSEPAILYAGTPVVLASTTNADRSANLAPLSSAWWLGWRCVLGLGTSGRTAANLERGGECVLNLPSSDLAPRVDALARTTGAEPVPERKRQRGYRFEPDKFVTAGLTPQTSELVAAPRVRECPIQMEAIVEAVHGIAEDAPELRGRTVAVEARVRRVHVEEEILADDDPDRIDPDRWRPLIMSFQHYYGLESHPCWTSGLARIPERMYRTADSGATRTE